ncbi:MAG: SH3 domain-containing protein [Caldilineaceae bacterium]|nr:SH3 domain-containing protein [Caldilineaceae bacterium]
MQNSRLETRSTLGAGSNRSGNQGSWLITLVLIPILLIVALLLPPINLLDRLQALSYTRIPSTGGMVIDDDGTLVNFPSEGVTSAFYAALDSTPRADFIAGQGGRDLYDAASNLPQNLIPKSPVYHLNLRGSAPVMSILDIPIPNDSLPYETLSVYEWTGSDWRVLNSEVLVEEDRVVSSLDKTPSYFMVMQTTADVPSITADLGVNSQLPQGAVVTQEAKPGLYLRGDGALEGTAPVNSGNTTPIVRNWQEDVVRTDLINNLLIDPGLQANQLTAVEQTIVQNQYPGVIIDYRGIDAVPSARADYVRLMSELADRLHAAGKTLGVRVELPTQVSADQWQTGGYDWSELGNVADTLIVPTPADPRAFMADGEMAALLEFATGHVERSKLQFELPAYSVERAGNYLLVKGYQESLLPLVSQLGLQEAADGQQVNVSLDNERLLSEIIWDDAIGMYYYVYRDDQGGERTVYVENADSVAHKLEQLRSYNVSDAAIIVPENGDIDSNIWSILLQFQQGQPLASTNMGQLAVAYTVYDESGNQIAQETVPLSAAQAGFAQLQSGYQVEAQIINSAGQPVVRSQPVAIAATSGETDSSTATAAASSGEVASAAADTVENSAPSVSTDQIINVRQGPGTQYSVVGQTNVGADYAITGKNEAGDWWEVDYNGQIGWIIGQLVNTSGDIGAVALAADIPEAAVQVAEVVEAPAETGGEATAPAAEPATTSAPAVAAPPPSGAVPFGYGIQAHMVHTGDAMIQQVMASTKGLGFTWVKQQIEWRVFEANQGQIDFGSSDPIVNAANANGISLLFSVVNSPAWAREPGFDGSVGGPPVDPQTYANFVGAMAGKYCGSSLKMIEVWNEQNLHYEWGNKALNPGEYVQLLAPAYAAIKAACPSMIVVSGALTPAGNNAPYAMDDFTYLEGMMQAGAANYLDAVGVHPSGYNVPPSSTWEGACEAIQVSGNSFNGACDSPHHSWSFRSTMEGYRNIMNVYGAGNRSLVPTEFGWAAGGAFNPAYQYANDNSYEEQATWTVEAYQMMKNWGWVGPAFLWNLNFRVVADGSEKAQWGIVDNGWGPLPAYNALAAMPK